VSFGFFFKSIFADYIIQGVDINYPSDWKYIGHVEKQSLYCFTEEELKEYDKEQNTEWKEECERLAGLVKFWQESYYKVCPPNSASLPKIDNIFKPTTNE